MSKAAKNSGDSTEAGPLPFEEALHKLEAIVESMEGTDLPLETLLTQFEEGMRLAQACQAKLAEAELKVQQLEKSASGQMTLKPMPLSNGPEE